jgi:hypothetical protein
VIAPVFDKTFTAARKVPVLVEVDPKFEVIDTPPPESASDWMVVGLAEFWLYKRKA